MSLIEARSTPTPMEILRDAVDGGADVATLEKLLLMQERWEAGQARKAFYEAKAAAKAEIPPIHKNREGHNGKRYADFFAFASTVDPILAKHGLSYSFRPSQPDNFIHLTCVLFHRAGHAEENTLKGPPDTSGNKNAVQAIGSTVTYLQRYTLGAALGLAATDDDDGRASGEPVAPDRVVNPETGRMINPNNARNSRDKWTRFVEKVRSFTDLDELEQWWADGSTQAAIDQMPWAAEAAEEYEKAQEKLLNAGRP